ncbi:MAG TPA: methionine ABC transporter ATP-binding protein [Epulopiscium sp.]|nr:methionine ABC transporter ATP-binding protein [Candidatus Epulonipiscium sp.]
MIQFQDVSVTYEGAEGKVKAVQKLSLNINKGEIFGIVGASGAGKSTLLRTINLLERPTEGRIFINNQDITDLKGEDLRLLRQKIGMIFQHFNLIKRKTVFENVAFPMVAAGKPKDEIQKRVNQLLNLVGLSDKSNAFPAQLSGGQKQRVGIARALANETEILLCDEPTSALDLETTKSILNLLKEINQKLGITIVIITHEMDVVKSICDRVAVMNDGQLLEAGNVYDVFVNPRNVFTKQLIEHTFHLEFPKQIFNDFKGRVLKIVYKGESATEPLISEVSKRYNVNLNIVHGKIEYIGDRPVGTLVVDIEGEEREVQLAVDYINERTAFTEVVLYAS